MDRYRHKCIRNDRWRRFLVTFNLGTGGETSGTIKKKLAENNLNLCHVCDSAILWYAYNFSRKLKSITDPFNAVINYNDDKAARTTSITGSNFASQANYATGIEYRAFGGMKEMTYGSSDGSTVSYEYDDALRPTAYQATSSVLSGGFVRKASYEYFADGQTKKVNNLLDSGLDQNYAFDAQGRLTSSISGQKLNNQSQMEEPFTQSITYNAFGDMTGRTNEIWGEQTSFGAMYTNGRKTGGNEVYDKAGNLVDKTTASNKYDRWRFDAAGRNHETVMRWYQPIPAPSTDRTETIAKTFDGDGLDVKRVDSTDWFHTFPDTDSGSFSSTEYYIRSTVLGGQIVTKLNSDASKKVTLVYTGSGVLAEQRVIAGTPGVYWRHEDAMTGSYSKTTVSGAYGGYTEDSPAAVEYDPLGGAIPTTDPNYDLVPAALSQFKFAGDVNRPEYGCAWDGTPVHCSMIGFITRSSSSSTINVNVRAEGGYNLYSFLERSISTWRYNVREVVNDEDARLNRGHYADDANWHGNKYHLLVGVFYAQYLTSAGETVISRQTQTQPTPLSGDDLKKWESERERLIRLLGWIGDKGKSECRKFLEKMGFDVNKIRQNLGQQTPYDAFKSLNDANEDFGHKGITVAEFFGFWGKAKFEGGAATGNTGKIYYSQGGITLSVILHETLHAAFKGAGTRTLYDPTNPQADTTTGVVSFGPSSALISDKELQKKLGIKRQLDSTNISKELEKRGCK